MADTGTSEAPLLPGLTTLLADASRSAQSFVDAALPAIRARTAGPEGRLDRKRADAEQHVVHGLGWYAAYAALLASVAAWAARLEQSGAFGEIEALLAQLLFAEYAAQLQGGIAMNQAETIRPWQLTPDAAVIAHLHEPAVERLARHGGTQAVKTAIAGHLASAGGRTIFEDAGLGDTLDMVRDQFFAFTAQKVTPYAHGWHLADELIPLPLIAELGAMGVFGMTIPTTYGGLDMGKLAMCVVSEELSRGWIGVGSLATRSEIAAELILTAGTDRQKADFLPRIASGEMLPTAVFTEPDTGSDLGALRTRALRDGDVYRIHGNKTWITHAARADLMTLLVRTDPATRDYRGLSMLLAAKPRGDTADPFPAPGMSGGEIGVIGYRGMKEYEIGFDGFAVPAANLLGSVEGHGFKQLMATFESARIQTAARAVGVAQAALDVGLAYAQERRQFGSALIEFPRIANKLALLAAEIMGVRQLDYVAARRKDEGKRCDSEAGMAKLLAARIAWAGADNAVQIHGGNGFATEYPVSRLLADARILNIFEGAGEIQAQVIGRRLLDSAA